MIFDENQSTLYLNYVNYVNYKKSFVMHFYVIIHIFDEKKSDNRF